MRLIVSWKGFTPANTGLDKKSEFPELGSAFKAAFVQAASWFFSFTALKLSEAHPGEPCFSKLVFGLVDPL